MTTLARAIEATRRAMATLALPVVAYADPAQARREALAVIVRALRDEASVVHSDAFVLIGTALILVLIVAQRLARAPQFQRREMPSGVAWRMPAVSKIATMA